MFVCVCVGGGRGGGGEGDHPLRNYVLKFQASEIRKLYPLGHFAQCYKLFLRKALDGMYPGECQKDLMFERCWFVCRKGNFVGREQEATFRSKLIPMMSVWCFYC